MILCHVHHLTLSCGCRILVVQARVGKAQIKMEQMDLFESEA